ncbi:MAG: hypothetical protein AB1649_13315 [Chloroflexota bacterium]
MHHPLEFLPTKLRKPLFFTLLALTLVLFAVFGVLDQPLRTYAAPNGIVSFELAWTPENANLIVSSWQRSQSGFPDDVIVLTAKPQHYAAFGLGLDYLFMPAYSLALSLGILLAAGKHPGWFGSFGGMTGWSAVGAAIFDAVENYALFRILLGEVISPYPEIAAFCATIKFVLILLGIIYVVAGWIMPKRS